VRQLERRSTVIGLDHAVSPFFALLAQGPAHQAFVVTIMIFSAGMPVL